MRIIFLLIRSSIRSFSIAAITSALSGLCMAMMIKLIHQTISTQMDDPTGFILTFLFLWVSFATLVQVSNYTMSVLSQDAFFELRIQLIERILKTPYKTIESIKLKILPALTQDVNTISNTINRIPPVMTAFATVIGCVVYLIWISWELSIFIAVLFGLVFITMKIVLPMARKHSHNARVIWDEIYKKFEGLVYGLKEIKLNQEFRNVFINSLLPPLFEKQKEYRLKETVLYAFSHRSVELIVFLGIGCMLYIIKQTELFEFSFFGEFLTVVLFILSPLSTVSNFINDFKKTEVALEQLEDIEINLNEKPSTESLLLSAQNTSSDKPLLEYDGITHQYYHVEQDENFTLGPVKFSVQENEIIFIVGGNGSGKTTLAKLLSGLYTPDEGCVRYKGVEITEDLLDDYRNRFTAIFTDFYLFEDILHVEDQVIEEKSKSYIEALELNKKIKIQNKKYSTTDLSQGQRKRLALLTSLMENKDICLFDEWAANQDPHFKSIFYYQILPDLKRRGKTIFVISHDEEYFDCGDRVITIREGQLVGDEPVVK